MKKIFSSQKNIYPIVCIAQPIVMNSKKKWNLDKQRLIARRLAKDVLGEKIRHSKTGRPIVDDNNIDISLSHREDRVVLGIIEHPYRIGVDIEYLLGNIQTDLFLGTVIHEKEQKILDQFCKIHSISFSSGIIVFWSLKESFFKCIDYDLKPAQIYVDSIENDQVFFSFSKSIKRYMNQQRIQFEYATIEMLGEYILTQTIIWKKENI